MGHGPGRPAGGAEHAVVDGEAGRLLQARDAQGGGDGAPPRRQQGAGDQDQHVAPDRGGEAGRERAEPGRPAPWRRAAASTCASACSGVTDGANRRRGRPSRDPVGPIRYASASRGTTSRAAGWRWCGRTAATRCTADARAGPWRGCGRPAMVIGSRSRWRRRDAWGAPGDFGPVVMPLDEALAFIAAEGFFWDPSVTPRTPPKGAKSSSVGLEVFQKGHAIGLGQVRAPEVAAIAVAGPRGVDEAVLLVAGCARRRSRASPGHTRARRARTSWAAAPGEAAGRTTSGPIRCAGRVPRPRSRSSGRAA